MNKKPLNISWNVHGVCVLAHAPDGKPEFLVLFNAHDKANGRFRSRAWRIKEYAAARKAFDKIADTTGDAKR